MKTMGDNTLPTVCFFVSYFSSFEPSDSTRTYVCSENRQFQARLKNVISLDTMKRALERKDHELAGAQMVAWEKTEVAEKKLASVGKLEEENARLKTAIEEVKKKLPNLRSIRLY